MGDRSIGMKRWARRIAGIGFVFALGYCCGVYAGSLERRTLLKAKLRGELDYSWFQTAKLVVANRKTLPGPLVHLLPYHLEARDSGSCPAQYETPAGAFWARASDLDQLIFLQREEYMYRVYDQPPVSVRSGDVVVDAGSNLGVFTRFALNRGARLVVAFEPEPVNLACFNKTFHAELKAGRVRLVESALWDNTGTIRFSAPAPGNSGGGSMVSDQHTNWIDIPTTTLDSSLSALGVEKVDFIKMDIEGAERKALLGASATIQRSKPRMALSTEHLPDDPQAIREAVLRIRSDYQTRARDGAQMLYFH
jgi:FkbM family methyltransferase